MGYKVVLEILAAIFCWGSQQKDHADDDISCIQSPSTVFMFSATQSPQSHQMKEVLHHLAGPMDRTYDGVLNLNPRDILITSPLGLRDFGWCRISSTKVMLGLLS